MRTLAQLLEDRAAIVAGFAETARSVQHEDYSVTYVSTSELNAKLRAVDALIAAAQATEAGAQPVSMLTASFYDD